MLPNTSSLHRDIVQRKQAFTKRERGWSTLLIENLKSIKNILDVLYEYVSTATEPSVKNLDEVLDELNAIRKILTEDVIGLDAKLNAREKSLLPTAWNIFAREIQQLLQLQFPELQQALRLYVQLAKARPAVMDKKNIASLKKDIQALESQRRDFLKSLWNFKELFSRYINDIEPEFNNWDVKTINESDYAKAAQKSTSPTSLRKEKQEAITQAVTKHVEIILDGDVAEFTAARQSEFVGAFAILLNADINSIRVLKISSGSIVIIFEMPELT